MKIARIGTVLLVSSLLAAFTQNMFVTPTVQAESYVAGVVGINFADRINSIAGTGPSAGVPGPLQDFDLQNPGTPEKEAAFFIKSLKTE